MFFVRGLILAGEGQGKRERDSHHLRTARGSRRVGGDFGGFGIFGWGGRGGLFSVRLEGERGSG